jgi:hypothetical protein
VLTKLKYMAVLIGYMALGFGLFSILVVTLAKLFGLM